MIIFGIIVVLYIGAAIYGLVNPKKDLYITQLSAKKPTLEQILETQSEYNYSETEDDDETLSGHKRPRSLSH